MPSNLGSVCKNWGAGGSKGRRTCQFFIKSSDLFEIYHSNFGTPCILVLPKIIFFSSWLAKKNYFQLSSHKRRLFSMVVQNENNNSHFVPIMTKGCVILVLMK
jgi:hypothetical protein